jgi:transcriptional regulator with XRE-family HTH domain
LFARQFGENLKACRVEQGLTQTQVAEEIPGMDYIKLIAYEKGRYTPDFYRTCELALAIGVPVQRLIPKMFGEVQK